MGDVYRHFKGGRYELVCYAREEATNNEVVVYRNVDDTSKVWTRPVMEFFGNVRKDGYSGPRFVKESP